jgi:hypothetical protein
VSQEEAHRRTAASWERVATGQPVAGRTTEEAVRPQPPLFTARTDRIAGAIRTRGHLDRIGAEALCRLVTALQQLGHRQIVVGLGSATVVDEDAEKLLTDHVRRLRSGGVHLLVR